MHWRLQGSIFAVCFGVMPLVGLALSTTAAPFLPPVLALGLLFLGFLQTLHEVGFLLRLLLVLLDGGTHLVLVDHLTENEHLDEGDNIDQHVIIAQT